MKTINVRQLGLGIRSHHQSMLVAVYRGVCEQPDEFDSHTITDFAMQLTGKLCHASSTLRLLNRWTDRGWLEIVDRGTHSVGICRRRTWRKKDWPILVEESKPVESLTPMQELFNEIHSEIDGKFSFA